MSAESLREQLVDYQREHPIIGGALWVAVSLIGVLMFLFFGALSWGADREDRGAPPVEIQAIVTEVGSSSANGGTSPRLTFVTEDGETGWVDDRSGEVGEEITVYRLGSGSYAWTPPDPEGFPWVPAGLLGGAGLCLLAAAYFVLDSWKQVRAERRQRSR